MLSAFYAMIFLRLILRYANALHLRNDNKFMWGAPQVPFLFLEAAGSDKLKKYLYIIWYALILWIAYTYDKIKQKVVAFIFYSKLWQLI